MQFLTPLWLIALAAICIPVVIHLWNIKPGKTLKVGSISLFRESSPKSSRSFKVQDILLLLLRCLMLMLLAFLLAVPLWQQRIKTGKIKGWLLIPKENFTETYKHFKPAIDSISKKKGYELHYFNNGFLKADLPAILQHPQKDSAATWPANYWALILQLEQRIPSSVHTEIFTPNTLSHFNGSKPKTNLTINWHTYTPADSVSTWLSGAWLNTNGNIRVVLGTATPTGTAYHYSDVKNDGSASAYNISLESGVPVISLKNMPAEKIKVDTISQRIAIYTDKYSVDANYLKAALNAICGLTQRKTIIKVYSQPDAIPANQDWIFWLSEKADDGTIAQKTKNLFAYENGKMNEINSWISNSGSYNITQGQPKIALYKSISTKKTVGNALWTDGFGNPILSIEQGKTVNYHFYNRFNPAWNDLVWSDDFPKWLLELTAQYPKDTGNHDRRIISAQQSQPTYINASDEIIAPQTQQISLVKYLWLILALVFIIERWLATKNNAALVNG